MKQKIILFIFIVFNFSYTCKYKNIGNQEISNLNCIPFNHNFGNVKGQSILSRLAKLDTFVINGVSYKNIVMNDTISIQMLNQNSIDEIPINISLKDFKSFQRNTISILNQRYCIDSLVLGKEFNTKSPSIVNYISNIYKFKINESEFIACYFQDLINPTTFGNFLILLFEITSNRVKYIPVGFQASDELKCFDNLDNSGELIFYKWSFESDTLFMYNFENGMFLKSEYFLKINQDTIGYKVCKNESKWIKDIWK
jgi:hypothetical protein